MTSKDLEDLAAARPLVTRELHAPNAYYGHATLLKAYAGLPARTSLKVAVEHGIAIIEQVWDIDRATRMPLFLCGTERRAQGYRELAAPTRDAVAIGPMIAYAPSNSRGGAGERPRRLVAFPAHSTHRVDAVYDVDEFAEALTTYREEWDEVVLCVYWRDVLLGRHRAYIERGFECTTAGHMYDPQFLVRLRAILEGADAAVTNEVGSHLLYAVALGTPISLHEQPVAYEAASSNILEQDGATPEHWQDPTILRLRELFTSSDARISPEQRDFVHDLIGMSEVKAPDQMRALLLEAEEQYRSRNPGPKRAAHAINARVRSLRERLTHR